ncbi:MAG: threonine/serine dehydratase [Rhodospirillales bacterium]
MTLPAPSFADVAAAHLRIRPLALRTPLLENERVNQMLGGRLLLKAEVLQRTGSFKFRGALNFIIQLDADQRKKGVVAWSSGNHAQGVAEAARLLNVPAAIVMPSDAPALKVANTRASGAEIFLYDRVNESREEIAKKLASERGAMPMPPYDHPWIIAGQGTSGIEVIEAGIAPDAIIAPCSGGGLATGISLAMQGLSPHTETHAAEPAGFDDMARSLKSGRKERNEQLTGSICDALLAATPGDITFAIAQRNLKASHAVTDDEARDAMELAFREFKIVVEPGGAVALAAVLTGKLSIKGRIVVAVCSGGNVDTAAFMAAIGRRK